MAAELGSEVEAAEMATVGLLALMLVVLGISLLAEVVTDVAGVGTAGAELPPPLPLPLPAAAAEEEEEEVEEEVEAGMPRRWSRACAMEVTWVLPQTRWWFSQSLCWQNEPQ